MTEDKRKEILETISNDMEKDARIFDGQPFDGKTVAKYFGNQGAAIAALADIIGSLLNVPSEVPEPDIKVVCNCNEWNNAIAGYCMEHRFQNCLR